MTSPDLRVRVRRHLRVAAITTALLAPLALAGTGLGTPTAAPARTVRSATCGRPPPRRTAPRRRSWPARSTRRSPATSRRSCPKRKGTDIAAPCGTPVLAAHPGTAQVITSRTWAGPALVRIVTSPGSLFTTYAYMRSGHASSPASSSRPASRSARSASEGRATRCSLHLRVRNNATRTTYNPTRWLDRHVGQVTPSAGLYGDGGINVATFNVLGASHTARGGNKASWPNYDKRLPKQIAMLEAAQGRRRRAPGVPAQAAGAVRRAGRHELGRLPVQHQGRPGELDHLPQVEVHPPRGQHLRGALLRRSRPADALRPAAGQRDRPHDVRHQRAQPGLHLPLPEPGQVAQRGAWPASGS